METGKRANARPPKADVLTGSAAGTRSGRETEWGMEISLPSPGKGISMQSAQDGLWGAEIP